MSMGISEIQRVIFEMMLEAGISEGRVYDDVPQGAKTEFPYVEIAEVQIIPADVQCQTSQDQFQDLRIWSEYQGWNEVQDIADRIHDVLHAKEITVPGRSTCFVQFDTLRLVKDQDGRRRQGLLTLRIYNADQGES